jgi:hypothetical protein
MVLSVRGRAGKALSSAESGQTGTAKTKLKIIVNVDGKRLIDGEFTISYRATTTVPFAFSPPASI